MIKVILIDDHDLVRSGLRQMLEADSTIKVVGEAGTGAEGIQLVRSVMPDVVVLDVKLPDISGLEVTNRLISHQSSTKILIVSSVTNDLFPFKLLEAGAQGYLTKNASAEELVKALKSVHAGQRYISPAIANRLVFSKLNTQSKRGDFSELSDRETEVMMMVINGFEVKKIAQKLHLSSKTVHSYRSRIFQKLQVKSDMGLMLAAIKQGIVSLDETDSI